MTVVFITDIHLQQDADNVMQTLRQHHPELAVAIDMEATKRPYPCGHAVLQVKGTTIAPASIIATVQAAGYKCDVMEDKVCM